MIELVASENATIFLWGFFILLLIIAGYYVYSKLKFRHKANDIAVQIKKLSEYLDELFKPNKRVKQDDIDVFLEENKITIDAAKEICLTPSKYKNLLKSTGIEEFNIRVSNDNLQASLKAMRNFISAIIYSPILLKKSFPLSSTRMKAGKSSTRIFQMASIPSSGYSTHSMLLMLLCERTAATPPMVPR